VNTSDISLGVLLRELKCFSIESLEERMLIQKKIYLLINNQSAKMPYNYNWYLHGPYCPSLTRDCYRIIPNGAQQFDQYNLTDAYQTKVKNVNLFEENKPDNVSVVKWYELLASVLYINLEFSFFGIKEHTEIIEKVKELKPLRFSDKLIQDAINLLIS